MTLDGAGTVTLPVTEASVVRVPPRFRERHLTPDVSDATVQAAGPYLNVWLFSDRQDVCLSLPLNIFTMTRSYHRSVHRWGVNVNRWADELSFRENGDGEREIIAQASVLRGWADE